MIIKVLIIRDDNGDLETLYCLSQMLSGISMVIDTIYFYNRDHQDIVTIDTFECDVLYKMLCL